MSEQSSPQEKRRLIAGYLGFNPWDEEGWPVELFDDLAALRDRDMAAFIKEIYVMTYRR